MNDRPLPGLIDGVGRLPARLLALLGLLAVFASEPLTQLGFAHGLLYILVILLALFSQSIGFVAGVAIAGAVLTLAGVALSPPAPAGFGPGLVAGNRLLALACIGLTAALSIAGLRFLAQSRAYQEQLAAAARQAEQRALLLKVASEAGSLGGWTVDLASGRVRWSEEVARIHGRAVDEQPHMEEAVEYYAPEWRSTIRAAFESCARQGQPFDQELELLRTDGERVWIRTVGRAVRAPDGRIVAVEGAFQDISARKRAESSLHESRERFRQLADAMPLIVWTATRTGQVDFINRAMMDYTGAQDPTLGQSAWRLSLVHPQDRDACRSAWSHSVRTGEPYSIQLRIRGCDGEYRWHLVRADPVRDEAGAIVRWYGSAVDVHEYRELQESARRLSERLASTLESIGDAFFTLDRQWRFSYLNGQAERLLQRQRAELLGKVVWDEFPDAIGTVFQERYQQAMEGREPVRFESHYAPLDTWFDVSAYPVEEGVAVYFRDVSAQRALEDQLRQHQRLESIGQLTGGVAHDFNNLLTVIVGNAELLGEELAGNRELRELAGTIEAAAQRGAELTARLLAFARRQALEPRIVDVNRLVAGMDALLRRTLGEHIEIEFARGGGLWQALVDPGQLESAVLNLAINARDAMPNGGRLTIETANVRLDREYADRNVEVEPGQYVMVAVSDTGTGIAPGDQDRVFEPFFTTKGMGQGTGLGLSMVYGFVKQSRGHVKLYSEPGQGTTVRMYLPRSAGATVPEGEVETRAVDGGGAETILLVEDDELVRRYAREQLMALGYRVIEAGNGPEALEVVQRGEEVDLLFTDVVMPGGMSGRQLAEAARALRPQLKVLYTSGYTENAIVHHGRLDAGVQLLSKPYRRIDLARRVRDMLG